MSKLLQVNELRTEFSTPRGLLTAVDGVSFDIGEGEVVAVVGESGSGKSITAMSLLQLIPRPPGRIAGGSVTFDGKDLLALGDREIRDVRGRDIGVIFQEPMTALNPVLSIGRQLTEPLERHLGMSRPEADARAVDYLRRVKISDPERRLSQFPHHMSGGMRQRVMIAMALICGPKLIIADEPTTALDVTVQAQILELIKEQSRADGVAVMLITHNLGIVARYADRVNVMYAGRIVESGETDDIFHNAKHPYTQALLRSVPRLDIVRTERLETLVGSPPDLSNLPVGCSFAPRCARQSNHCIEERPSPTRGSHAVACWNADSLEVAT
jgi:oligopeptide/dipeptide ABC transporter ATP-binding protein